MITMSRLAGSAVRRARTTCLALAVGALAATLLVPGSAHPSTSPAAVRPARPLGESGLMLAAFNGTATITLSFPSGQAGVPTQLNGASLPISTLSFGGSNVVSTTTGGAGAGKPTPADITLTRGVDQYSPWMLRQVFVGTHANAVITVTRPVQTGQSSAESLTLTLTTSYVQQDTESHTTTGATENVDLYFVRLTVAYTAPNGVTSQWYYDRSTNTVG